MNDLDSELLEGQLMQQGFSPGPLEEADVAVLVTCCVRQTAENRALGRVTRLKGWKDEKPGRSIVLAGCLAQKDSEGLLKKFPYIDYIVGPGNIFDLPGILHERVRDKSFVDKVHQRDKGPVITYRRNLFRASVNISYGCNNYCAYCIVPFVRGDLVHRPVDDILQEVQTLLSKGTREITLLGQNVNAYRYKGYKFADLLKTVARLEGLKRLRFVTSHPKDFSYEIIRVMAEEPSVCESLHLPLQSGSDRILKLMGRKYTLADYEKTVAVLRREIPGVALSSDFITGFPGETAHDFSLTLDALKRISYDTAFLFLYNTRSQTRAAQMEDQIPYKVKQQRLEELIKLQQEMSLQNNQKYIGETLTVLVTHKSPRYSDQMVGRTRTDKNVIFVGNPDLIGKFVRVKIGEAFPATLKGKLYAHEKAIPY